MCRMPALLRLGIVFTVAVAVPFAACGGKVDTTLGDAAPEAAPTQQPSSNPTGTTTTPNGRTCPPECLIGHQCCQGGCGGIPVAMPSDCCSCLSGETDSQLCKNDKCGN